MFEPATPPETEPNPDMTSDTENLLSALKQIAREADELWDPTCPSDMLRHYYESFQPKTVLRLIEMAEKHKGESHLSAVIAEQRGAAKALGRLASLAADRGVDISDLISAVNDEMNPVPLPVGRY